MTRAELLDRLDVLLGGRTAEEIIFGDVSTGAQDDLQRATDLVRHMITRYGMSEALGLATFEAPRQALFLQVPTGAPREYSEETARVIDAEIQQLLEAAHTRVRATLTAQRALLESLAKLLIAHEVVDRNALDAAAGDSGPRGGPVCARGLSSRGRDGRGYHATCDVLIEWGANASERCSGVRRMVQRLC